MSSGKDPEKYYGPNSPLSEPKDIAKPGWYQGDSNRNASNNREQSDNDHNRHGASSSSTQHNNTDTDFDPGSMVDQTVQFGNSSFTIKGQFKCGDKYLFALESEKPIPSYNGLCPVCGSKHMKLSESRGYYASIDSIYDAIEKQKLDQQRAQGRSNLHNLPRIEAVLPPLNEPIFGRDKGIEGDSNSCYMDATIFCMFAYNNVFDSLLHKNVDTKLKTLQTLLRDNIVHVLRSPTGLVERDAMYHLRVQLSLATADKSFEEMEKDPSEFLRALEELFQFAPLQTLPPDQPPKQDLSNITHNIIWEMFDANPHDLPFTNIANIFRNSLSEIPAKLASIPPFLVLIAPRHKRSQRSYRYIVPDRQIILDNNILQIVCHQCGKTNHPADKSRDFFSCDQCCPAPSSPATDATILCFCSACLHMIHAKLHRDEIPYHNAKQIKADRHKLNLFAVVCIETSHYVAFVKCHKRNYQDEWIFFDSMSDRIHNNKNIPCVSPVPGFDKWLEKAEKDKYFFDDLDTRRNGSGPVSQRFDENKMRQLRLFRDGAFFFYENSSVNYQ